MHRDKKPVGFYHLLHGTVDSANNMMLGLSVIPGNIHDATVYIDNLDNIFETFDVIPKYAGKKGKKSKYWFEYDLGALKVKNYNTKLLIDSAGVAVGILVYLGSSRLKKKVMISRC